MALAPLAPRGPGPRRSCAPPRRPPSSPASHLRAQCFGAQCCDWWISTNPERALAFGFRFRGALLSQPSGLGLVLLLPFPRSLIGGELGTSRAFRPALAFFRSFLWKWCPLWSAESTKGGKNRWRKRGKKPLISLVSHVLCSGTLDDPSREPRPHLACRSLGRPEIDTGAHRRDRHSDRSRSVLISYMRRRSLTSLSGIQRRS